MLQLRQQKISTQLILLTAVLLSLALVMAVLIYRKVADLEDDARILNQFGMVRGAIQRLVKLEVYGHGGYTGLEETIDGLMADVQKTVKEDGRARGKQVNDQIDKTAEKWQELKAALAAYRAAPSELRRDLLVTRSEECWRVADAAVLAAQQLTERKVGGIRLFYLLLAAHAASALLVLWMVYVYVRKKMEYQATHDNLTGLLNRHAYEWEVENETNRSRRYGRAFSLIIFDVDYFKRINDRYGHKSGDQLLAVMGQLVREMMRKSDKVFRIGGEEFAVLASETGRASAVKLAEKIRQEVEGHPFQLDERITVSVGVAEVTAGETPGDLFRKADAALYQAKEGGRNQVRFFSKGSSG